MMFEIIAIWATVFFLAVGTIFTLVAAIGLLKLVDPMSRLHAPTKAGTLGIGAFLIASVLQSFVSGEGSYHELLILAFLFVTAPVSANFIAKVNIHKRTCVAPPPPPLDDTWSTLATPAEDREVQEAGS